MLHPRLLSFSLLPPLVALLAAAPRSAQVTPCAAPSPTPAFASPQIPLDQARVYRDENGVAHIEARTQTAAWRALGYEEGRDALFHTQARIKRHRGRFGRYFGANGQPHPYDIAVKIYRAYLGDNLDGTTTAEKEDQLRLLLRREGAPTGRENQVFDNLKAFAEGLEAYRVHLRDEIPSLNAQEVAYKAWLDDPGFGLDFSWVYEEIDPLTSQDLAAIDVFDIASWSAFRGATQQLTYAMNQDPRLERLKECPNTPGTIGVPLTSQEENSTPGFLSLPSGIPLGSNCYAWSNSPANFMSPAGDFLGGLVSDPHQSYYSGGYRAEPTVGRKEFEGLNGGRLFAHIRVVPDDGIEPVDVFGWKDPAAGMFSSFFNQNVAVGGSQGSENPSDAFLLRVQFDGSGELASYYSYYTDSNQAFTSKSVTCEVGGSTVVIPYLQAGPFGIVMYPDNDSGQSPVLYAECWEVPCPDHTANPTFAPTSVDWRAGLDEAQNEFRCEPELGIDMPVVVAYRSQYDEEINLGPLEEGKEKHLYRLAVGAFEGMLASSVDEIQAQLVNHDGASGPNFMAMDRDGRIFATVASVVPQRSDLDALCAYAGGHINASSLWDVYDQSDGEPVPARFLQDAVFDWRFVTDPDGKPNLQHLEPHGKHIIDGGSGLVPNQKYQSYVYLDPSSAVTEPACVPTAACLNHPSREVVFDGSGELVSYENMGFVTMSNNEPYLSFKREFAVEEGAPACQTPCSSAGTLFTAPENTLLENMLITGTLYSSRQLDTLTLEKNRNIMDRMIRCALGEDDALVCNSARDFATDIRTHVPRKYTTYGTDCTPSTANGTVPTPVRNLVELRDGLADVIEEAEKERAFFEDLWAVLGTSWFPYAQRWVLQTGSLETYWYPNVDETPNDPSDDTVKQFIPMPTGHRLIDFLWSESRLGSSRLGSLPELLSSEEVLAFDGLVDDLADSWASIEYRNDRNSQEAALLLEYDLSFNAALNGTITHTVSAPVIEEEGRVWTPIWNGMVRAAPERFPQTNSVPDPADAALCDPINGLPSAWAAETQFLLNGDLLHLYRYFPPYKPFARAVFGSESTSAVRDCIPEGLDADELAGLEAQFPMLAIPTPPYDALYADVEARIVRGTNGTAAPTPAQINALVKFFLCELGGFTLEPERNMGAIVPLGVSTTSKVELVNDWEALAGKSSKDLPYPFYYPLTRNLARVLLVRRLLEAADFADGRTLGDILRARVYDLDGTLRYPQGVTAPEDGVPCDGSAIRHVSMFLGPNEVPSEKNSVFMDKGFQDRLWAGGGSDKTMLVLFPEEPTDPPRTYFLHYPGTRPSAFASQHFVGMVDEFAESRMAHTHFTDYASHLSPAEPDPAVEVFATNPYLSPGP